MLPPSPRRPNPVTQAAFRRQVRLEVYLPIGLTVLGILVLVIVAVIAAWGTSSSWADVVIVILGLPLAIALLLLLAGLVAGSVGLIIAIRRIPEYTAGLQDGVTRISHGIRQGSDAAARTVIIPSAAAEAIAEAGRALRSMFRSG